MAITKTDLRAKNKESGSGLPKRSMDAFKVNYDGDTDSGWIDKEFMAVFTLSAKVAHSGITAKVYGRYKKDNVPDATTEAIICDKEGVAKSLDLDQDSEGATFVIDEAAPFDQVKVITSGNITGDLVFGFGA